MARLNLLSDIEILNAPRRPANYMLGDGGNLYLRVLAGEFADKRDGKDWWFRYQTNGTRVKLALGPYTDVRTKEARNKAAELRKLIDAGVDPLHKRAEDEADRRTTASEPQTVAEAFDDWKLRRLPARKDGGKEVERMFKKDVISAIGSLPMKSVRRRDIVAILDTVHARGSKRMTGQLLNELRLFMNHAVDREWIEGDITAGLKASRWDGQTKPRTRILADTEISELAKKLAKSRVKNSTASAIWIMLSTMCRVGALEAARWDDINFEKRTWQAARKSQEEEQYTIFLSPFALSYFQRIKAEQEDQIRRKRIRGEDIDAERYEWVFPAKNPRPAGTKKHVTKKTLSKQIYSYQIEKQLKNRPPAIGELKLSGGDWSAHDLRRTGSTIMARKALEVDDNVRELCLNHGPKNPLDRVYNQNEYEAEMRTAWERLGDVLSKLQGGVGG
jgi:integrase